MCSSLLYNLSVILFGLLLPRLYLTSFGSELNGLDSTIKQIFSCLTLLEAGVGLASQQAYYLPVAVGDRKAHQRHFFGHASLLPPHRYRVSAGHGGVCAAVPPVHQHSAVLRHREPDRGVLRHPGHRELSGAGQIPLLYGSGRQKLCDHLHHHGHHGGRAICCACWRCCLPAASCWCR